ncbi:MAG: aminoacyl-tRNA hydrolase [Planctomycetia bacterium]|nr:aminoacyl-tRNA hydrolase [Planctomycetia bacterium]
MKVIVGLGNPGDRYARTRHNVGYDVVDDLVRRHLLSKPRIKFEAEAWEFDLGSERLWLLKPLTFMNNSGRCVRQCVEFFQIQASDLLVVCDDLNLSLGQLRMRATGSDGGQKGLRDIRQQLGTEEYARLRIGIGRPPGQMDAADFVLSKISKADAVAIDHAVVTAADAVELWSSSGVAAAMNRINVSVGDMKSKKTE